MFLFDFTGWPEGRPIVIPAFTAEQGRKEPQGRAKALAEAEDHRYKCVSVMNAHLACMTTAMTKIQGACIPVEQVITPSSYFTTHWVADRREFIGLTTEGDPLLAYVLLNCQFRDDILGNRIRTLIQLDTVEYSTELLEKILTSDVPDMLRMTTLIYNSAFNHKNHDFPTALTLSWTVCEKLLAIVWNRYLKDSKRIPAINRTRREILTERDYTASIVSEVLELAGRLNREMYENLSNVRRRRNEWLHELGVISGNMSDHGIKTALTFMKEVSGIELLVHTSHSSRM